MQRVELKNLLNHNLTPKTYRLKPSLGGPLKLRPAQTHKTKKAYNRKKTKKELAEFTKTPLR